MKTFHIFVWACLFSLGVSTQPVSAATRVLSQPYLTDFEFFDNGLFYWGGAGSVSGCGPGEFGNAHALGTLGFRGPKFKDAGVFHPALIGAGRVYWSGCGSPIAGGVARDDAFLYYSDGEGLWRLPASLLPSASVPTPTHIGNYIYADRPGALMIHDNELFFAAGFNSLVSGPNGSLGRFQIYSLTLPVTNVLEGFRLVAHGGTIPDAQLGRVKKMKTMTVTRAGIFGDVNVPVGIALGDNGVLLRYDLYSLFSVSRNPRVLAYNVADFDIRTETRPVGQFGIEIKDQLYAAVNDGPIIGSFSCSAAGRLNLINANDGVQTQIWPRAGENYGRIQVTDVALDNSYIFLNTRPVSEPGGPFGICSYGQEVIRSARSPANTVFLGLGGIDPDYQGIELDGGHNLRSDGHWLYFTRADAIWRITNAAPPLRLDFGAFGLEAVQVIQNMNNSVRLVEGKRTVVRGYAREVTNTTANANWFPVGELRGWRNNVELPGSPLRADNAPALLKNGNLVQHRSTTANNYLFELPSAWVRSGTLSLQFTVNPGGGIYESGGNPYANNSAGANLQVVRVDRPCFVFAALKTVNAPNFWPWENPADFNSIIERATSLLPVPSLDLRFTTEQVSDVEFFGDCGLLCHDPFDFSVNDDWNEALEELADYDAFDDPPPGCPRTYYVGAIHPNAPGALWGGLGETPGSHFLAIMATNNNGAPFNSFWAGRTIAHEFAHNLGRLHVDQTRDSLNCGTNRPARPDPNYPNNSCTFGPTNIALTSTPVGFDMASYAPVLPNQAGDLLSYSQVRWPSTWTYNAMLDALAPTGPAFAAAAVPPAGPYVLVRGMLKLNTRTVRLKPCYSLPDGTGNADKIQASLDAAAAQVHDYRIRQLDETGALLGETLLVISETEDGDNFTSVISQFVVKQPGAVRIQITKGAAVLAECRASATEPVIAQLGVTYDPNGPTLQVAVNAADADGDALYHTIQFSPDDGMSWRNLRINTTTAAFVTDARRLPGGETCRVRVITTDGFHSTMATSEAFAVERRAPEVLIGGLKDGERVPFGANINVTALAVDPENGALPGGSSWWDITGPTPLVTTEGSFNTRNLAPGFYSAAVRSTDSDGNTSLRIVTFQILPFTILEAAAPTLDGEAADAAYASAPPVFFGGGKAVARFTRHAGYLYASFTGMPYGRDDIYGAVGLRLDADASGEATAQPGDRAFYVNENGTAWQLAGDGTALVAPAVPESGFKAVVSRGDGGWSAEFRIAESLVGGWEHPARLSLELGGADCIFIVFTEICFPTVAYWPPTAEPNNPATWAGVYSGTPPAPVNQPPVAVTPTTVFADLGTPVFLSGAGSFDPDGDALTYAWTQLEGSAVTLADANTATPSFTLPTGDASLTFRFQLIVSDGALESLPAETLVTGNTTATSPLPSITTDIVVTDGTASGQILWPGRAGDLVVIQASTDLITWTNIGTNSVGAIPVILFQDAEAGLYPYRFYRATSAPSGITLQAGNALVGDGVAARVEVPHDIALNIFPLTISFWLNSTDTDAAARGLVSKYADGSLNGYSLFLYEGRVRGWYFANGANYIWDGSLGLDSGFVADGQWHYITLMVDDAGGRLYVDSSLAASRPWTGTPSATTATQPLQFGRYFNYPTALSGQLDDVSIWSRTFSGVELFDLMHFSPVGDEPALLGLWRFDEEDVAGPTTGDSSGHGHVGELLNNATRVPSGAPIRR